MIDVKETTYGQWGKCIRISNGSIELYATVDIGPRIIRFGKIDGENVMFEDVNDLLNKEEAAPLFAEKFGEDKGVWHIYGGHRLWISPEYLPRTYYPDNEPVKYELTENGVILTPPQQVWNQVQYVIEISMSETEDKVSIEHKITNKAPFHAEFAPWALTVLAQGGKEIIPRNTRDTGLLGNGIIALWPYTKMTDKRVFWGDKYITLKQDKNAECPFKIGLDSDYCWAAYLIHGDAFIKRYDSNPDGIYPDGGVNFETYTYTHFLEMETLGELKNLAPEETVSHKEIWEYAKNVAMVEDNDDDIQKFVDKYIN